MGRGETREKEKAEGVEREGEGGEQRQRGADRQEVKD